MHDPFLTHFFRSESDKSGSGGSQREIFTFNCSLVGTSECSVFNNLIKLFDYRCFLAGNIFLVCIPLLSSHLYNHIFTFSVSLRCAETPENMICLVIGHHFLLKLLEMFTYFCCFSCYLYKLLLQSITHCDKHNLLSWNKSLFFFSFVF